MRSAWGSVVGFLFLGGLVVACDPDLNITTRGGGGSDGGPKDLQPSPTGGDASPSIDPDGGQEPVVEQDADIPPTGRKIDGVNDFAPSEKLPTTSSAGNYDGYIAWDPTRLYFGMSGPDVGSKAQNKWVHVYLGVPGVSGTKTGIPYGSPGQQQQPKLPFDATHHLRWKVSGDYSSVEIFEAGAWKSASAAFVPIVAAQQGNFVEMSITRASINATGKLAVHMNMLIEGGGADWTYAGVPSTSFTDGKNPSFGKYFEFDLANTTKAPNAYAAQ